MVQSRSWKCPWRRNSWKLCSICRKGITSARRSRVWFQSSIELGCPCQLWDLYIFSIQMNKVRILSVTERPLNYQKLQPPPRQPLRKEENTNPAQDFNDQILLYPMQGWQQWNDCDISITLPYPYKYRTYVRRESSKIRVMTLFYILPQFFGKYR